MGLGRMMQEWRRELKPGGVALKFPIYIALSAALRTTLLALKCILG